MTKAYVGRRPTPKAEGLRRRPACRRAKNRGREGGDSRRNRVGESIPDGWRPEASPPAVRRDAEVKGLERKAWLIKMACLETIYSLLIFISTCSKSASQLGRLI